MEKEIKSVRPYGVCGFPSEAEYKRLQDQKRESIRYCRRKFTLEEIKSEYLLIKRKKSKLSANDRKHIMIVSEAILNQQQQEEK